MKKILWSSGDVGRADPESGRWSVLPTEAWSPGSFVSGSVWRWEVEGIIRFACPQHLDKQPPILRQTDICIDIAEEWQLDYQGGKFQQEGSSLPRLSWCL